MLADDDQVRRVWRKASLSEEVAEEEDVREVCDEGDCRCMSGGVEVVVVSLVESCFVEKGMCVSTGVMVVDDCMLEKGRLPKGSALLPLPPG